MGIPGHCPGWLKILAAGLCPPRRDILRRSWDSRIYCMSNAQNRWRPGQRPNHAGESHNAPRYPCIHIRSGVRCLRRSTARLAAPQPLIPLCCFTLYTSHLALEYWNQIDAPVCSHLNVAHIWHTASYTLQLKRSFSFIKHINSYLYFFPKPRLKLV